MVEVARAAMREEVVREVAMAVTGWATVKAAEGRWC